MAIASPRPYAKKSLGQHFLADANICRRIVGALDVGPDDVLLEVGPGCGALTRWLLSAAPRGLICVEKDHALAMELATVLTAADLALMEFLPRLQVVEADALTLSWEAMAAPPGTRLKLVGNLPYNVASPLMWELVSRVPDYDRAVFMVQREVALRLAAPPGGKQFGALSAWIQSHARVRYLFTVPPGVFRPPPKVDSAVVEFRPLPVGERPAAPNALAKVLHLCFQKRRKQLSTILKPWWGPRLEAWFHESGVSPKARPETLAPQAFMALSEVFASMQNGAFAPDGAAGGPPKG